MLSPVTLCRFSYHGLPARAWGENVCDNLIASCSVRDVAHESHDWLSPGFWAAATEEELFGWRHCEGVSGLERRAAGASTPPATASLLSSLGTEAHSQATRRAGHGGRVLRQTAQRDRG